MTINHHPDLTSRAIPAASQAIGRPQRKSMNDNDRKGRTTNRGSTLKRGFALAVAGGAVVATALVACSTHASNTATTSNTATASGTTTPAATGGATTTPSATVTAGANFVGAWHVHGATLTITPTTATYVASIGPCGSPGTQNFCSETITMNVVSATDEQLTLAVTGVTFTDQTGVSVPNPNPGPSTAVGDTMQLTWQAPGLLKETALHGFPELSGGNPNWCGAGISQANLQLCGA